MTDFSNDKPDSTIAVSPALASARQDLSKPSGDNSRVNTAMMSGAAGRTVNDAIDGSNPVSIGPANDNNQAISRRQASSNSMLLARADDEGVRAPSTFAQLIEKRLREAENSGAAGGIDTSPEKPAGQADKPATPTPPKAQTPGQAARPTPPNPVRRREIIIDLPPVPVPVPVPPKPAVEEHKRLTKEEIIEGRKAVLTENKERHVNSVADMKKAEALAKELGVPLVVDFGFPSCPHCIDMEKKTFPQFAKEHKPVVIAHVNVQKAKDAAGKKDTGASIFQHLNIEQGSGYPQTFVFAPNATDGTLKPRPMQTHDGFIPYAQLKTSVPPPLPIAVVIKQQKKK